LDLHSPKADAVGRVDVLAARLLKTLVDRSSDPYLKAMYHQYQPVVDAAIQDSLRGLNCAKALRQLGLAQPKQPKPKPKPRPVRTVRPRPVNRAGGPGLGVVGVEFIDGPGHGPYGPDGRPAA